MDKNVSKFEILNIVIQIRKKATHYLSTDPLHFRWLCNKDVFDSLVGETTFLLIEFKETWNRHTTCIIRAHVKLFQAKAWIFGFTFCGGN